MNIDVPDSLKSFLDEQVAERGFGSVAEYIRKLIEQDNERQVLRRRLLEGAASSVSGTADAAYFAALRARLDAAANSGTTTRTVDDIMSDVKAKLKAEGRM